jgi:hypothetical protein
MYADADRYISRKARNKTNPKYQMTNNIKYLNPNSPIEYLLLGSEFLGLNSWFLDIGS